MAALLEKLIENGALVSVVLLLGYAPLALAISVLWRTNRATEAALRAAEAGWRADLLKVVPVIEANTEKTEDIVEAMAHRTRATEQLTTVIEKQTLEFGHLQREIERRP